MLRHFGQLLDGQVTHSAESDVIVLKEFRHRKEKVSRLSRRELFALIRQIDNLAACFRATSRAQWGLLTMIEKEALLQ